MGVVSCRSREASLILNYIQIDVRRDVTSLVWSRKEGTPARQQGGPFFGKASLLYGETVIEYHTP